MKLLIKITALLLMCFGKSFSQTAFFNVSKDTDCNILKITIDATGSKGKAPLTYFWNFGNGNMTSGTDKAIVDAIYVQPGEPKVSLYVIDANGAKSDTITKVLHILSGPKIDFDVSQKETCIGKSVEFINKTVPGSSPINGYIWNVGNSITLHEKDPRYVFNTIGDYDVSLIVTDENGCNVSLKKERLISVSNILKAEFKAGNVIGCSLPFNTTFIDTTKYGNISGHKYSYKWDFGDGTSSGEHSPDKSYSTSGSYNVKLTINDLNTKCVSMLEKPGYITMDQRKPSVSTTLISKKCTEYTYSLKANISGLPSGINKTIDFGDGAASTLKNTDIEIFHTYNKPGKFFIKTTYINPQNDKCQQVGIDSIIIPATGEDLISDNISGCKAPFTANFSVRNIQDGLTYSWDFGDGTNSTDKSPSKTYTTNGTYTVKVKIASGQGCGYNLEKKDYIKIGPLTASFTSDAKRIETKPNEYEKHPVADPTPLYGGCIPFKVNFKNTAPTGSSVTYHWDFGDGTTLSSQSLEIDHTYNEAGIYSPSLTVNDGKGCQAIYNCKDCVSAGKPPVANVTLTGPDTVCCLYEKTFTANVKPGDFDMLWYNVVLNDGSPSGGLTQAYYKNAAQNWILEDNTGTIAPFPTEGYGLDFKQSNFALPSGNQPDFYFYAYKNGCASKIIKPKYQAHLLPWGTFKPLPCNQEEELQGGDIMDFNKIGGDWILGKDTKGQPMKLSKARVKFTFNSKTGCSMPELEKTFTPAELGFDLEGDAFQKIQKLGLFPKIKLPDCAVKGDELLTTTYLYTSDDAKTSYQNGNCLCQEHWPYKIGAKKKPSYTLSQRKGCAPLSVTFTSSDPNSDLKYQLDNGIVISGSNVKHVFTEAGTYRFKTALSQCDSGKWTDSIVVSKPSAKFSLNQNTFCLNSAAINEENKTIRLKNGSPVKGIKSWKWNLGNGVIITKTDSAKVDYTYSEKDLPIAYSNTTFVKLTVTDINNCTSSDSSKIILRKTTGKFSVKRSIGCYDSLTIIPADLKFGRHPQYSGRFKLYRNSDLKSVKVIDEDISDMAAKTLILDTNGTYKMQISIAGDALGKCQNQYDSTIIVKNTSLVPGFKITGKTKFSCVPSLVNVTDASTKFNGRNIKSWNWKFTNSSTKGEVNGIGEKPIPFALTDSGYYSLNLSIEDESGCKKSISRDSVIFINDLQGKILDLPKTLCPDEPGNFSGLSANAQNVFWDFGDGIVGTGLNIEHSFKNPGEKFISFIVTDSANCKRSYSGKILVKKAPLFNLGNDTLICEKNSIQYKAPVDSGYVYQWNTGEKTSSLNVKNSGLYALHISDTLIKCDYKDSVYVKVSKLPYASIDSIPAMCRSENIILTGHTDILGKKTEWIKDNLVANSSLSYNLTADGNPVIIFKATNGENCSNRDTIVLNILERPRLTLSNQSVCPKDSFLLKPDVTITHPGFKWQWAYNSVPLENDTLNNKWIKKPGKYSVSYGKPNCMTSAEATLVLHPLPDTKTNPEKVNFCEEFGTMLLDGGESHSHTWLNNNETNRYLSISNTGSYILKLGTEFNCYSYDTVIVETRCAPKVYVPNAFTPEIEGENKTHKIFSYNIGSFTLMIFNRWGELIYETISANKPWDGTYRNELMPSGVYPWVIKYSGNNPEHSETKQMEGKVILER